MGWPSRADVERWFTYQPPSRDDVPKLTKIRDKARELALVIHEETPPSADQSAALRQLREAVMTANAAIVVGKKPGG